MKNSIKAIALLVLVVLWQACGTKSESATESEALTTEVAEVGAEAEAEATTSEASQTGAEESAAATEAPATTFTSASGKTVYYNAEVSPEYKGGTNALAKFLGNNLKYPSNATEEGTVQVSFVVTEDGSVQDAEVQSGPEDAALRSEALRVINKLPKWTPGQQGGQPVSVKYLLPITFKKQ